MPRQQVYGKRSRTIYDPRAALSSPDQNATETKPARGGIVVAKRLELKAECDNVTQSTAKSRRALGEKQANAVVQPLEALDAVTDIKRTAKPRRKENAQQLCAKQHIDGYGEVAAQRTHTFVEDDDDHEKVEKEVDIAPAKVRKGRRRHHETERLERLEPVPAKETKSAPQTKPRPPGVPPLVRTQEDTQIEVAADSPRRSPRKHEATDKHACPAPDVAEVVPGGCLRAKHESPESDAVDAQYSDIDCPYQLHCLDLLELSAHPLTSYETWSTELSEHFAVTKIAEASFGEVYRLSLLEDITDFGTSDESVFKIIALQPPEGLLSCDKRKRAAALKRSEGMSMPSDVTNEVKLLQRMSSIPGFTNFRDVRILRGRPPKAFVAAFKAWNDGQKVRKKDLSHFPDPAKKSSYSEDQLWAVIEMQDAGNDLERLVEQGACTNVWTIWDVFWQTVLSIAKGEEGAEFEHRDLHLGNICVRCPTGDLGPDNEINTKRKLNFTSLETTIIDYTISRCNMPDSTIAYTDLASPSQIAIFEGDSTNEYQYDIYRYMRGALYFDHPYAEVHSLTRSQIQETGRNWKQFHAQTNLVWLHLVLYKLLDQLDWPSAKKAPPRKLKKEHMVWKRANDLEHVLLNVQELLDPGAICQNGIRSASDLVGFAVGEGWLDLEDVIGNGVNEADLISQLEGLELA